MNQIEKKRKHTDNKKQITLPSSPDWRKKKKNTTTMNSVKSAKKKKKNMTT